MCCLFLTKQLAKHQQCEGMKRKSNEEQQVPCSKFVLPMPNSGQHLASAMFMKLNSFLD